MHIPGSPRPYISSEQHNDPTAIDELLTRYRANKHRMECDPAEELILFVKNNPYDNEFEDILAEQPESVRADLCKQILHIFIDENMRDQHAWSEFSRPWKKLPASCKTLILNEIVETLNFSGPGNDELWQWVWSRGENIEPPENRGAFFGQLARKMVAAEQYALLDKILDHEIEMIGYADRYFRPDNHRLSPLAVGASFWPDMLDLIKNIPEHDAAFLPILTNIGTLINNLKVDNPAVWNDFVSIVTTTKGLNPDEIEKYIGIGCQNIKKPKYWNWIIDLILSTDVNLRYPLAKEAAGSLGKTNVKDTSAWTKLLDILNAMPEESRNTNPYKELLGSIIYNLGKAMVTNPALWNTVIDGQSTDANSWNSTNSCSIREITSQMFNAKVTDPDLSFRLIKLHATALFQHLQKDASVDCGRILNEIEMADDLKTLVEMLFKQPLPADEKSQLLELVSRSMAHAVDDMALWAIVITQQVQEICDAPPCPEFIALKYHVTDLCKFYETTKETFDLIFQKAIEYGKWQLNELEAVQRFRREVAMAAPDFPWQKLFQTEKQLAPQAFCTFPDLADASKALSGSIQVLAAMVKTLPRESRAPFEGITMVNGTLTTKLLQEKNNGNEIRKHRATLAYFIKATKDQVAVNPQLHKAIKQLVESKIDDKELNIACSNVLACYQKLSEIVQSDDCNDRYKYCDFYTCEVLEKEAASALVLGNAVSCCLATDGGSFNPEMINRLTHPSWVPVVARDYKNNYVAVAWCAITHDEETKEILLVEDFADIAPRFSQKEFVHGQEVENRSGNYIMKRLHEYIRGLATHLELERGPLIGKQARGRMENFDVFAKNPETYFFKPKLSFLCNKASTVDNIQHVGVRGQFF